MANYQETSVVGTAWQRCYKVELRNPIQGDKLAIFLEEEAIDLGNGKMIVEPKGALQESFSDPSRVINILDPVTGLPTGEEIMYQDLYNILYSLYMQLAVARDQAVVPETGP
jgi:hypothetical protein